MSGKNQPKIVVTTLGTSHGDQTYCRFNSSTLLEVGDHTYLVDAGAPVEALLVRAGKPLENLKAVLLTHMHNDHVGGLAGLIKAFIKYPKRGQYAQIFMPEEGGIEALTAWLKAQHMPFPSDLYSFRTTLEGPVFFDDMLSVHAVRTRHYAFPSYAYVFETHGKRIVCSGDLASDFSDFPEIVRNEPCDLCICESTHFNINVAIEVLKTCPIKKLVFNHISNLWHGEGEQKLKQLLADMPFECAIAHDGDTFSL